MHYKLTKEIVKLSNSKYWDTAKNEWNFEYAYYSEELQMHIPVILTPHSGHIDPLLILVLKNVLV